MKNILSILIVALLMGCSSPQSRTYMGHKVIESPFVLSGGEVVKLPITDAGPIPAETDAYKVVVAGFSVGESETQPHTAELTWGFALRSKVDTKVSELWVEEVFPAKKAILLYRDNNPVFKNGLWRHNLEPIAISASNTPFLYTNKASIYVFRFTVIRQGQEPEVLLQPAWFSRKVKAVDRQIIEKIQNG